VCAWGKQACGGGKGQAGGCSGRQARGGVGCAGVQCACARVVYGVVGQVAEGCMEGLRRRSAAPVPLFNQ